MLNQKLIEQLLSLPQNERLDLAQVLWESLDQGLPTIETDEVSETIELAAKRDAELTSGTVAGRSHEEVMEAARRGLECV